MKHKTFKIIIGAIDLLFSAIILLWIAWNVFVKNQLEIAGVNPIIPTLAALAGIYFGIELIKKSNTHT